ncbi:MAG: 4Fe-4S binding protein, partial [Moorella sp. (in: Bacteria)]|nr:4Fe-4S binding protein [Moorella sp. (in: firmicutes)]
VALLLPTKVAPLEPVGLDEIAAHSSLSKEQLEDILEGLCQRGVLFCDRTRDGKKRYALHQVGYGFPQAFFWKGEEAPHARKMADLIGKYFNRRVTREAYAGAATKAYRYVPVGTSLPHDLQAVYPYHMMEAVVRQARVFAVAHCPCRLVMRLRGKGCEHPLEVCLKFDEMAQYLIDRGLGREITGEEALEIIKKSEEAGLVHFVDNAANGVKHNCNCCGCACWNVGNIRRRKIPRDELMATYFLRDTDEDRCTGCGECAAVCPVEALTIKDGLPVIDEEWCIGCGVCVTRCPSAAARLKPRPDKIDQGPLADFKELHERILLEKGLSRRG